MRYFLRRHEDALIRVIGAGWLLLSVVYTVIS